MTQFIQSVNPDLLKALDDAVMYDGGKIRVLPFDFWKSFNPEVIKNFMLNHGVYVIPTAELVEWFAKNIEGNAIEIGAGHGSISRTLGIPITDSRMQERPEIKLIYESMGQPPIKYPLDVEKLSAVQAIKKYKPNTIIGTFITHKYCDKIKSGNALGVNEEFVLQNVNKYMLVGNIDTHHDKPIRKLPHDELYFDWLITRSVNQSKNRIWIWQKSKS